MVAVSSVNSSEMNVSDSPICITNANVRSVGRQEYCHSRIRLDKDKDRSGWLASDKKLITVRHNIFTKQKLLPAHGVSGVNDLLHAIVAFQHMIML